MIDLELAKKIGATHYTTNDYGDLTLCRVRSGIVQFHGGKSWESSGGSNELLSTLERIDFNEPSNETLQSALDKSQLKVMELTEQLAETKGVKVARAKVEYIKCDMSLSEIAKAMIDGEIFYDKDGLNSYAWSGHRFEINNGRPIGVRGDFYRRTEVEIDWRKALSEFIDDNEYIEDYTTVSEAAGEPESDISEKFDNEFIKMCHLVAELTDKPE